MKVYNQEKTQELFNYDLTKGRLQYDDGVQVFIPFTEEELKQQHIRELKQKLFDTDYKAIKYAEGVISEQDYASTKSQRQAWREEIRSLGG